MSGEQCGLPHPSTGRPCIVPTGLFHREHSDGSLSWDGLDEQCGAVHPDTGYPCSRPGGVAHRIHASSGKDLNGVTVGSVYWEDTPSVPEPDDETTDQRLDRVMLGMQSNLSAAVEGLNKRIDAVEKRLERLGRAAGSSLTLAAHDRRIVQLERRLTPAPHTEPETCTARLIQNPADPDAGDWPCIREQGHAGMHTDSGGDSWDIRYG